VREATVEDAEAVALVHVRAWQAAYAGILPDDIPAELDPVETVNNAAAIAAGLLSGAGDFARTVELTLRAGADTDSLFSRMRSGRGFLNDLHTTPDVTADVRQPTLVIATRNDGGVPFAHAQALTAAIRHARLVESHADSHFIWHAHDWPNIAETIRVFLTRPTSAPADRRPPSRTTSVRTRVEPG
jgi:pimeloyl-ACP methyl ester carboxylesterase